MRKQEAGFSLIEVMASMMIFSLVLSGLAPAYVAMVQYNTRSQIKTEAISVAQRVLDELRLTDPTTLPSSGSTAQTITLNEKDYSIYTTFCPETTYCSTANNRHIRIQILWEGTQYFQTETVFTQLR